MFIGINVFLSIIFVNSVLCRDFYVGMFRKNDLLKAQDVLYKERSPYGVMYASYGRKFDCPITYIRVVDRLGVGRGPIVEIIRGGLKKHLIVLRLTSVFNQPISVNIYIGCENKRIMKVVTTSSSTTTAASDATADTTTKVSVANENDTTTKNAKENVEITTNVATDETTVEKEGN